MKKHIRIWIEILVGLAVIALTGWYLHGHLIAVLQPAGQIGYKERNLIVFCAALSILVVVPVFVLLGYFAWRYREGGSPRAKYTPDVDGNVLAETIWWLIPTALLVVIGTITWRSTFALDPFKPIASNKPVLHIQVVALDWKWLFIYPGQNIATVNQAAIPVGTPVDFELTSDTVMTSFWDPQLGGQMYAMPGMNTQLNLMASKPGTYAGAAANISGKGFAGMKFNVLAVSDKGFNQWTNTVRQAPHELVPASYAALARPSQNNHPAYYASVDSNLYDTIVMKYMMPLNQNVQTQTRGAN